MLKFGKFYMLIIMTLFVRNESSITRIQEIFRDFFELSGLKVNIEKTNVMRIGKKKGGLGRLPMGKYSHRNKDFRSIFFIGYKN